MKHPLFWLLLEGGLFTTAGVRGSWTCLAIAGVVLALHLAVQTIGHLGLEDAVQDLEAHNAPSPDEPTVGSSYPDYD